MIDAIQDELRLIDIFRQKAAFRQYALAMQSIQQYDDERKQREKLTLRKEEEQRKLEEALATPAQVAAFDAQLDKYDTATVHALMDNQHALELVQTQRVEMEAAAFKLPDGRMAFKTADNKLVFDQHGAELGPETVQPEAIPESAPRWEAKQVVDHAEGKLLRERDELHEYQARLDQTRDTAGRDGVTADALTKLDADLRNAMPDAVKARVSGAEPAPAAAAADDSPAAVQPTPASRIQLFAPAGP